MEKEIARREFNPAEYGMSFCLYCGGSGKTSDSEAGDSVCSACGGFGWIGREGNPQPGLKGIHVRYGAPAY